MFFQSRMPSNGDCVRLISLLRTHTHTSYLHEVKQDWTDDSQISSFQSLWMADRGKLHTDNTDNESVTVRTGTGDQIRLERDRQTDPQPMEAWVVVEELHLFGWQGPQDLLDGEELVKLTLARKQRLTVAQLAQNTPH